MHHSILHAHLAALGPNATTRATIDLNYTLSWLPSSCYKGLVVVQDPKFEALDTSGEAVFNAGYISVYTSRHILEQLTSTCANRTIPSKAILAMRIKRNLHTQLL